MTHLATTMQGNTFLRFKNTKSAKVTTRTKNRINIEEDFEFTKQIAEI